MTMDKKIVELANSLSNENMCDLITLFSDRIDIYIGMSPNNILRSAELDKVSPAIMNGATIQINTEWAFSEKVIPFTREALK